MRARRRIETRRRFMTKAKILMIDDQEDLALLLKAHLNKEGYGFFHSGTAENGLIAIRKQRPDLILLDIVLPGMDGLELLRVLRRETGAPVIFLSSTAAEIDRVLGLRLGADDYLTKPFSFAELEARIHAVLQRTSGRRGESLIRAGGLEVDLERHEVRVNGRYQELAPREFQLLQLLLEAEGKVVSRDGVLEALWGVDDGLEVSSRIVDQHVARLRRKLLSERERVITVKNIGYRIRLD